LVGTREFAASRSFGQSFGRLGLRLSSTSTSLRFSAIRTGRQHSDTGQSRSEKQSRFQFIGGIQKTLFFEGTVM